MILILIFTQKWVDQLQLIIPLNKYAGLTMKEVKKICQYCKHHKNKPSKCFGWQDVFKDKKYIYVGRKSSCERWRVR